MWSDLGFNIPITEGTHWLDNGIIKGFDGEKLCSLYKYTVADDLSINVKQHKDFAKYKNINFETWQQTIDRLNSHLDNLEKQSITLLKQYSSNKDRTIIDTNSTGKDSMVKTYLAQKAGLKFETYFNVTTLDVAESNHMAKELDYKFIFPKDKHRSFYQWQKNENIIPSRLNRACCMYFKENPTIENFNDEEKILFLFGMRNSESNARSGYEDVWINDKWGKNRDWIGILPIRQWTDLDIWLYIFRENILINEKYKMGYPRVGWTK